MLDFSESDTDDGDTQNTRCRFESIFESSSSSNCSSDEDCDREVHAKVADFIETIHNYSNDDFKSHFRLSKSTVQYLIGRCSSFCY